jgi:selT/selW/selH-like putative selenoprotein
LLNQFGEWIDGITLIPGDRGIFDLTVNGKLVYSKLQTKRFPEQSELNEAIAKLLD